MMTRAVGSHSGPGWAFSLVFVCVTSGLSGTALAASERLVPEESVICGALQPVKGPISAVEEEGLVLQKVKEISALYGATANIRTWLNQETSLGATIVKDERVVLYDQPTSDGLKGGTKNWTILTFLAHEIGHHFMGHPLKKTLATADDDELARRETQADRFAGGAVRRMGGTEQDLINAYGTLEKDGVQGYPSRMRRLEAARTGWNAEDQPKEAFSWNQVSLNDSPDISVELQRNGIFWEDIRGDAVYHNYEEVGRNDDFILLEEASTGYSVLIPTKGGIAYERRMGEEDFVKFATVEKEL